MNGTNADPDQAPYHAVPVLFPGGPKGALASTGVGQMPPAIIGGGGTLEGSAGHRQIGIGNAGQIGEIVRELRIDHGLA